MWLRKKRKIKKEEEVESDEGRDSDEGFEEEVDGSNLKSEHDLKGPLVHAPKPLRKQQ